MTDESPILPKYDQAAVLAAIKAMPEDPSQRLHMSLVIFIDAAGELQMPLAVVIRNVIKIFEVMEQQTAREQQR